METTEKKEKKKGKRKGTRSSFTLCFLDKKTKLVASEHSFIIKEKIKTKEEEPAWVGKFFYSDITDAVKGYARHFLRKPELASKLDGSVEQLIKVLLDLDKSIADSAQKFKAVLDEAKSKPAENKAEVEAKP